MLKVQKILKNNTIDEAYEILEKLGIEHHIEVSPVTGNQYLHLDYSIFAEKSDPIVKECRGLALELDTFDIVRYGFNRFMNLGETGCDIPFSEDPIPYEYEEKADGSIIILSFFEDRWIAGSRGRIFPTEKLQNGLTYEELFWKISGIDKVNNGLNRNLCYVFEICSMFNRVVIPYKNEQLVLLNARIRDMFWAELASTELYVEYRRLFSEGFNNIRRPNYYFFKSIKECVEKSKGLSGFEEGFVVKKWNPIASRYDRAKIKGPAYLDLHHVITGFSLTNLCRMVFNGDRSSLESFEEQLSTYDIVEAKIKEFNSNVEKNCFELMTRIASIEDSKERKKQYAILVKGLGVHPIHEGLLFNLYFDNKQDVYTLVKKNIREKSHFKKFVACLNVMDLLNSKWNCSTEMSDDI